MRLQQGDTVRNRRFKNLALPTVLALAMPWITAQTAIAADPIAVELTQETQRLVDIIREGDEAGVTSSPVMVSTNCNYQRQWWHERCGLNEALVPFTTSGPGSAVWNYVALFRVLPKETEMGAEMRREYHRKPKHVSLVTFAFISEPFGLIDWKTAHVEGSHVIVQTRHWIDQDGHLNPSGIWYGPNRSRRRPEADKPSLRGNDQRLLWGRKRRPGSAEMQLRFRCFCNELSVVKLKVHPIAGFVLLSVVGARPPLHAVRGSGGAIYRA